MCSVLKSCHAFHLISYLIPVHVLGRRVTILVLHTKMLSLLEVKEIPQ